MTINRSDTLRYLRMTDVGSDDELSRRIALVEREVGEGCRPVAYWRLELVKFGAENGDVSIGSFHVQSCSLARVLQGCRHAFLFCATIGTDVDALLRRYSRTSSADALIAQAAATAAIESWCDECCRKLSSEPAVNGEFLRPRFSPGYGDLPLESQRSLLQILDANRRAGIVLTDTCLMIPSKSVSAVIGVGSHHDKSIPSGCVSCEKKDCEYRIC